jgi:hypothetical protein
MPIAKEVRNIMREQGIRRVNEIDGGVPSIDSTGNSGRNTDQLDISQLERLDPSPKRLKAMVDAAFAERKSEDITRQYIASCLALERCPPACDHSKKGVADGERFCTDCGAILGREALGEYHPSTVAETRNRNPDGTIDRNGDEYDGEDQN